jgi:hypothetical protein
MSMTGQIRNPVSRVRQSFAILAVEHRPALLLLRVVGLRGARLVAGFLKRYRDETVFVSPPRIVQRVLVALLARHVPAPGTNNPNDDV